MATLDASPRRRRIYWSAYTSLEGGSTPADPLRFDMYIERLGNLLLPGITNRTARLRYLSMVCAGLQTTRSDGSLAEQRRAFLPFERGWALAMTIAADGILKIPGGGLLPEFRGLRGANRVLSHYKTLTDLTAVRPADYVLLQGQDAQGGLGAYLVTLRTHGLIHPESLALTALGRELAGAFRPSGIRGARLSLFPAASKVDGRVLGRMGEQLTLSRSTPGEGEMVRRAVFTTGPVADVIARMRAAAPLARTPEERLTAIARPGGDLIGQAAAFAVAFDPLRLAALRLFARLGKQLRGRPGATSIGDLDVEPLDEAADAVAHAAPHVAALHELAGIEPISTLARQLASSRSLPATIAALVVFHRREGRSWIIADAVDRYRIGNHGRFDEPADQFNGYTVGPAFAVLDDLETAA